jgi:hypothetical protein
MKEGHVNFYTEIWITSVESNWRKVLIGLFKTIEDVSIVGDASTVCGKISLLLLDYLIGYMYNFL